MTDPAPPPLVDTHCHLVDPRFEADLEAVLERAWHAGVRAVVCPGYDLRSSRRAVELAQRYERVFAAVGIHPNLAAEAAPDDMDRLAALARSDRVVAIGETGLDHYRAFTPPEVQERFLADHLALAAELRLPVIVHNRQATKRLTELLVDWAGREAHPPRRASEAPNPRGVLHCFSGDRSMLVRCQAAGYYISFAGPLTYKHPGWIAQAAREVSDARMVVETDAPYLAPAPMRGQRNEPAYVEYTARRLAELRGQPYEVVARATSRNAARLFPALGRADPWLAPDP